MADAHYMREAAMRLLACLTTCLMPILANAAHPQAPYATVKITVEIAAEFPNGATDQVRRAVSENARSLGLKINNWE